MQRPYEVMYILDPRLDEASHKMLVERVNETITKIGGQNETSQVLGRKRMAYPIQKQKDGYYMLTNFQADTEKISELTRVCQITEGIMRHLIVRKDES